MHPIRNRMMERLGCVAFVLVASGCLAAPEAASPSDTTLPASQSISPDPSATSNPSQPGGVHGMNATGCSGSQVKVNVPLRWLDEQVPPSFRAKFVLPEVGLVSVLGINCSKWSVAGVDRGPGSLIQVFTGIEDPKTLPTKAGFFSQYVFESFSNNAFVLEWLRVVGLIGHKGTVSAASTNVAQGHDRLEMDVRNGSAPWYHSLSDQGTTTVDRVANYRWFFGDDPKQGRFESTASKTESSGDGIGLLDCSTNSALSRILHGATVGNAAPVRIVASNGVFSAPGD